MPLTGHCLCKAVTYTADVDAPLLTGYDHCDDCQRQSGSTYCKCASSTPPPLSLSSSVNWRRLSQSDSCGCGAGCGTPELKKIGIARINGPTKSWAGKGSSGKAVHRIFCSECGSPIAHDPDAAPEIIALKAGTLDTEIKKNLKPDTEIWTVGKLPFCQEKLAKPFEHMPQ